jgi:hypothetical protein
VGAFTPNHVDITERGAKLLQKISDWVLEKHRLWLLQESGHYYGHSDRVSYWLEVAQECDFFSELEEFSHEIHYAFCLLGTPEKTPSELMEIRRAEAANSLIEAARAVFDLQVGFGTDKGGDIVLSEIKSARTLFEMEDTIRVWGDSCLWAGIELSKRVTEYHAFFVEDGRTVSDFEAVQRSEKNRLRYSRMGGKNVRWLPIAKPIKEENPEISQTALAKLICEKYPDSDLSSVMRGIKKLFPKS